MSLPTALDFVMPLRGLTPKQRNAFAAAFLGWTLDAFDFFVLVFVIDDVAKEFHTDIETLTTAFTLTLAMRPLGALIFGAIADRFGRRLSLMINVIFYSLMEFMSGFAPTLNSFLILRALYGIGMGGEWGVGASLAMETIPREARGRLSGLLQEGYPVGYMLAAIAFNLVFPHVGWRGMFWLGILPTPIVFLIRSHVEESEAWEKTRRSQVSVWEVVRANFQSFAYLILLMTAFNFMSHGTQDLYPKAFMREERHFTAVAIGRVAYFASFGALLGGMFFGALSEVIGRRKAIVIAASLALPVVPLWVFAPNIWLIALGAFIMQFFVQGAWGVIPAHLNELSPDAVRGTAPGVTYQLGNLLASFNSKIQARIAHHYNGRYSVGMAIVVSITLVVVVIVTSMGHERKGVEFGEVD